MKNIKHFSYLLKTGLVVLSLMFVLLPGTLLAQSIAQGYEGDANLQAGMIVGLNKENSQKVEAISLDRPTDILGAIVNNGDSPIILSGENQKVFVAKDGKIDLLVSNQNGKIKPGDYISLSSIAGIGMKADEFQPVSVGKAIESFDGGKDKNFLSSTKIRNNRGQVQDVAIGRIQVDFTNIANPLAKNVTDVPEFIRRTGQTIAGRTVAAPRLYLGLILFIAVAFISASMIYATVKGGIVSLGRNPLSRRPIVRTQLQMIIVSIVIFISGLLGVYLILRL